MWWGFTGGVRPEPLSGPPVSEPASQRFTCEPPYSGGGPCCLATADLGFEEVEPLEAPSLEVPFVSSKTRVCIQNLG